MLAETYIRLNAALLSALRGSEVEEPVEHEGVLFVTVRGMVDDPADILADSIPVVATLQLAPAYDRLILEAYDTDFDAVLAESMTARPSAQWLAEFLPRLLNDARANAAQGVTR